MHVSPLDYLILDRHGPTPWQVSSSGGAKCSAAGGGAAFQAAFLWMEAPVHVDLTKDAVDVAATAKIHHPPPTAFILMFLSFN